MKVLVILLIICCSCSHSRRPAVPRIVKNYCAECKKPYDRLTKADKAALNQLIDKIK